MNDTSSLMHETLNGVRCQGCGDYIGEEVGYPRYCRNCVGHEFVVRTWCPTCKKWMSAQDLAEHQRAKHEAIR